MSLTVGAQTTCCLLPEMRCFGATILTLDSESILLQLNANPPSTLSPSQDIMISDPTENIDYYNKVDVREGTTLRLKKIWAGKRSFFRVDDVFPIIYRKVNTDAPRRGSKSYSVFIEEIAGLDMPDESINPQLWKLLINMNTKLGMILEQLQLESMGLTETEGIPVNISGSGMRFPSDLQFGTGDVLEVKMLLPTNPATGVLVHGNVVRTEKLDGGAYDISLFFVDLSDHVRDLIIQYTQMRQREIVRRYREQEQGA
jgi:hypothetical protein